MNTTVTQELCHSSSVTVVFTSIMSSGHVSFVHGNRSTKVSGGARSLVDHHSMSFLGGHVSVRSSTAILVLRLGGCDVDVVGFGMLEGRSKIL